MYSQSPYIFWLCMSFLPCTIPQYGCKNCTRKFSPSPAIFIAETFTELMFADTMKHYSAEASVHCN